MELYKLTNERGRTRERYPNCLQWGKNVTHEAAGPPGQRLSTDSWVHCYAHELVAAMRDCQDGYYGPNARLWQCTGEGAQLSDGLKWGFRRITTLQEVPLPEVTAEQRVHWGILCSLQVYKEQGYTKWAMGWLNGTERHQNAARIANTAYNDANVSQEAARAAYYAALAAQEASKPFMERMRWTPSYVAKTAGYAAAAVTIAAKTTASVVDFGALAEKAVKDELTV